MLVKLLGAMDRGSVEPSVISLTDSAGEPIWASVERLGVPLLTMHLRPRLPNPLSVWKLRRILREGKADVVQGWGVHGDLAVYASRLRPFIFNVRNSLDNLDAEKVTTRLLMHLLGRASVERRSRHFQFTVFGPPARVYWLQSGSGEDNTERIRL